MSVTPAARPAATSDTSVSNASLAAKCASASAFPAAGTAVTAEEEGAVTDMSGLSDDGDSDGGAMVPVAAPGP